MHPSIRTTSGQALFAEITAPYRELYQDKKEEVYRSLEQDLVKQINEDEGFLTAYDAFSNNGEVVGGESEEEKSQERRRSRGREKQKDAYRSQFRIVCAHLYSHEIHQVIMMEESDEEFITTRDDFVDNQKNFELSYVWENYMHRVIDGDFIKSFNQRKKNARSLKRYTCDVKRDLIDKDDDCLKDCFKDLKKEKGFKNLTESEQEEKLIQKYLDEQHLIRLMKQINACKASGAFSNQNIRSFWIVVAECWNINLAVFNGIGIGEVVSQILDIRGARKQEEKEMKQKEKKEKELIQKKN